MILNAQVRGHSQICSFSGTINTDLMRPINSYNSKYGKNNYKPIGDITEDRFEVSVGFTDKEVFLFNVDSVNLFDVDKRWSDE